MISSIDNGDCVMVIDVVGGEPRTEEDEGVGICVEP